MGRSFQRIGGRPVTFGARLAFIDYPADTDGLSTTAEPVVIAGNVGGGGVLTGTRITLHGRIIDRIDRPEWRSIGLLRDVRKGADTGFQPCRPGFDTTSLLSCARRTFTVSDVHPAGGGEAISTEDRTLCNFLRTKPLLWVHEGALFCLQGPYNGAKFHLQRGVVAVGPAADGAPSRA
jgi:hypothetical protein